MNHQATPTMEGETEPKRPQRRRYTKTKFGCKTCKIRKVRCDETWPACQNCEKTGRQCDGVSSQAAHNNNSNTITFVPPLTVSHFQPSSARRGENQTTDARSAQILRNRLIHCIVGDLSRPLWEPLMKRAAADKPFFGRALVAFAALCREYTRAKTDMKAWEPRETELGESVRASICAYDMNLRTLRNEHGLDGLCWSSDEAALCGLIYICFQLMMNESETALCQLDLGLDMLRQETIQVDDNLAQILKRLDLHLSELLDDTPSTEHGVNVTGPEKTFDELDAELTYIINNLLLFLRGKEDAQRHQDPGVAPLDLHLEAKRLDTEMRQCHAQVTPSLGRGLAPASSEDAYLRMRSLAGIVLSTKSLYAGESIYDGLLDDFSAMVDYAASLIQPVGPSPTSEGDPSSRVQPTERAALTAAVLQPLFLAACKCRGSIVRRRAVALMDAASGRGGLSSARVHASVARRIIQLEEACSTEPQTTRAGDPAAVPEWCRIHTAEIRLAGPEAEFAEVLFRYRPNGMDGEWSEFIEVVFW